MHTLVGRLEKSRRVSQAGGPKLKTTDAKDRTPRKRKEKKREENKTNYIKKKLWKRDRGRFAVADRAL